MRIDLTLRAPSSGPDRRAPMGTADDVRHRLDRQWPFLAWSRRSAEGTSTACDVFVQLEVSRGVVREGAVRIALRAPVSDAIGRLLAETGWLAHHETQFTIGMTAAELERFVRSESRFERIEGALDRGGRRWLAIYDLDGELVDGAPVIGEDGSPLRRMIGSLETVRAWIEAAHPEVRWSKYSGRVRSVDLLIELPRETVPPHPLRPMVDSLTMRGGGPRFEEAVRTFCRAHRLSACDVRTGEWVHIDGDGD